MKKIITVILTLLLIFVNAFMFSSTVSATYEDYSKYNLLDAQSATFEGGLGNWVKGLDDDAIPQLAKGKGVKGDAMLSGPRVNPWATPYLNIGPTILENGVGQYSISMQVKAVEGDDLSLRSLMRDVNADHHYDCSMMAMLSTEEWTELEILIEVTSVDKAKKSFTMEVANSANPTKTEEIGTEVTITDGVFNLAVDTGSGAIYIDNVCVVNLNTIPTPVPTPSPTPSPVPSPTPIPTPTKVPTATTTDSVKTDNDINKPESNTTMIIIIVTASIVVIGGGAALLFIRPKKKDSNIDLDEPK